MDTSKNENNDQMLPNLENISCLVMLMGKKVECLLYSSQMVAMLGNIFGESASGARIVHFFC